MREINVLPQFNRGEIVLPRIPVFQQETSLKKTMGKTISAAEALELFECMLYIRSFEEMIIKLKGGKFVPYEGFDFIGATHLSIGQEAVAAGSMSALEEFPSSGTPPSNSTSSAPWRNFSERKRGTAEAGAGACT
jgi:2-oxoisovalerate dehydrogenase E1 component